MSAKSHRSTKSAMSQRSVRAASAKPIAPMNCLVTGAGGYVALHIVDLLLKQGHMVRGTVRNLANEERNEPIKKLASNPEKIELVEADILKAEQWADAVKDIDVVFHVASPFPFPGDDQDPVKPAIEGTLNVLKACVDTKVKRVVVTSSGYALFGDEANTDGKIYTEADWADPEKTQPYGKSKILAEKAAWDFINERKKNEQSVFELAVVNPMLVLGPILSKEFGTSAKFFQMAFSNEIAGGAIMNDFIPCCDARDVALAHYRAATLPQANGERFIVQSCKEWKDQKSWREILAKEFNPKGMTIATDPVQPGVGKNETTQCDISKMIKVLNVEPTDFSKTLIDMANSFIEYGLVKL